jgi:hypothetical protein
MLREIWNLHSRVLLAAVWMLTCVSAQAQSVLFNEVHTIADTTQAVPFEGSFPVSVAGNYKVTLVDLGAALTPAAPLASVKLAITSGSTPVPLTLASTNGTILSGAGSAQFAATPGIYVIRVIGAPGSQPQSGPIAITVTNVQDNSKLASFSPTLAPSSAAIPSSVGTLDDTFTVSTAGSYVVTLSDLALPQPLTKVTLNILTDAGVFVTNPPLVAPGSVTVSLQPNVNYRVIGLGIADSTVNAGLYSATVIPAGGGPTVYNKIVPVGSVAPVGSVPLSAGGTYTLALADLSYPDPKQPLSSLSAVVAVNGQLVTQLAAAGTSQPFASVSGTYQVFALASTTTSGSYAVSLNPQSGPPVLSIARAVSAGGNTNPTPYGFDTRAPVTAGVYAFDFADFAFPTQFASINAVAVQNGAVLGKPMSAAGSQNLTVAGGNVTLLVFVQPGVSGSLFGIDLTASGAGPVIEQTQGVGQLFIAREVPITTAGSYAVNVSDVGFPAPLKTFAVFVTHGMTQIGSAYGGGQFTWSATPGKHFINFIAQPADATQGSGGQTTPSDKAGTYSLNVGTAPDVKLTSDVSSVASGGVAHLSWTTANAADCTASGGGWTGTQVVNGSATTPAITAKTTFTLTCTGAGATGTGTVTVDVAAATPPPASGGGGGGALDGNLLLVLFAAMALRVAVQFRRPFNF